MTAMTEQTPLKSEKLWCVVTRSGYALPSTLAYRRADAIARYLVDGEQTWAHYRKAFGLTVRRVVIRPAPSPSPSIRAGGAQTT